MSLVEEDIYSTPAVLRQTLTRVEECDASLSRVLVGPMVFLGCGSSYCVGTAAATLYEMERDSPAQGMIASQYRSRPAWTHVAISRTGRTTELIEAMSRARRAQALVALIRGDPGSPAEEYADVVLPLEFAPEQGVVQTRFVTASMLALRLLIGSAEARRTLDAIPYQVERALDTFDPTPLASFEHVVFLGRDWRYGLALAGALALQETALLMSEGHQTMDYRHGPISMADETSLIWCLDPPDDPMSAAVLEDAHQTGATIRCTGDDPLASLAQIQLLAVRIAEARGVDPDAPRHLKRTIVLPALGLQE
jgi:glucosamine--fructose-6-phosphate aminotransferase (isomerizing)